MRLRQVEDLVTSVEQSSGHATARLLFDWASYLQKGGLQSPCGLALNAQAKASDQIRVALWTKSMVDCPASCPGSNLGAAAKSFWEPLSTVPADERPAFTVGYCDSLGPELVFDGDMAARRTEMPFDVYLMSRHAFESARTHLDGISGDEAAALRERLWAVREKVLESAVRTPTGD